MTRGADARDKPGKASRLPASILVVDDDEDVASGIRDVLAGHVERIESATDVRSACALLDGWMPDVLILDILLPDGSAFDVLEHLEGRHSTPVVLVISGRADREEVFRLGRFGGAGFLEKPFGPAALRRALVAAIAAVPDVRHQLRVLVGRRPLKAVEREARDTMLGEALARSSGSRRGAARLLDVSRQLVQQMLRRKP
jgi:two-component system response regulator RegA